MCNDKCWITTIHFSVLVINEIEECFSPSRGIRQGCLLLPYIFILSTNALTLLIRDSIHFGYIDELKLLFSRPVLLHSMFVDDLFIFERVTNAEVFD